MKKLLFLLMILFPLTLLSQEEGILVDSIISYQHISPTDSVFFRKTYYERDYNHYKNLLSISFDWDSQNNDWVGVNKEEMSYDEDGRHNVLYVSYNWNSDLNDWIGVNKSEWGYDENDNQILSADYRWDTGQSIWIGLEKDVYEYNENSQELYHIYYNWDIGLNDWNKVAKRVTVFDSEGNRAYIQSFTWDSNQNDWVFFDISGFFNKDVYAYDENENEIFYARCYWSLDLNDWTASYIYERTFNPNNKKLSEVYSTFDWGNNPNVLSSSDSTSFTYDSEGHLILTVKYNWDINGNEWVIKSKSESAYDEDGNLLLTTNYNWDTNANEWYYTGETQFTYDSNGNLILLLTPNGSKQEKEYDVENNLIRQVNYRWEGFINDWVLEKIEEYDPNVTDLNITLQEEYMWNSTDGLYLYRKTIKQFDSNGNLILSESYRWNSSTNMLIGTIKVERAFDPEGYQLMHARYVWDNNINDWFGTSKYETKERDSYGKILLTFRYAWDSNLGDWVLDKKDYAYYGGFLFDAEDTICEGDSIQWQGQYLTLSDTYVENYISVFGRDSTYQLVLTVNPNPSSFMITGETSATSNETLVYLAPDNNTMTYNWSVENGSILSNPLFNSVEIQWGIQSEGKVFGIAINEYGCKSDTAELQVAIGVTGINDLLYGEIQLYPNPVEDILNISSIGENIETQILSMNGIILISTKNSSADLSSLPAGQYFVRIKDKNGDVIRIRKIIKN